MTNKDRKNFGNNLREARSRIYATQKEFADVLGLNTTTYGQYENNKRQPDFETLIEIAEKLHTTVDYLLTGRKNDSYERKICNMLVNTVYSTEKIHGFFENGDFCKVTTSYGDITLTMDWYEKLVAKADQKLTVFIREEICEEVVSQRINIEKIAEGEQITLEAKILCEALHYDYARVLELKNSLPNYSYPSRILELIYELYFYCLDCNKDVESLKKEILYIQGVRSKLESVLDVVDANTVLDANYYKAEDFFEELLSRTGERNHIAELYLMKHWGVTQDKMVDLNEYDEPFKLLKKAFINFNLLQLGQYGIKNMKEMLDEVTDGVYFHTEYSHIQSLIDNDSQA